MMSGGASLVGRIVGTASESATAAKDGANFVVLQVDNARMLAACPCKRTWYTQQTASNFMLCH